MNRRAFLASLAATMALDPERALWRPGAKLISIPKPRTLSIGRGDLITLHLSTATRLILAVEQQGKRYSITNTLVEGSGAVFLASGPLTVVSASMLVDGMKVDMLSRLNVKSGRKFDA